MYHMVNLTCCVNKLPRHDEINEWKNAKYRVAVAVRIDLFRLYLCFAVGLGVYVLVRIY